MMFLRTVLLLVLATPAAASQWTVVPAQSSLGFSAEWNGKTIEGTFPKFSANIRFDPAKLAEAKVDATIDLSAATTPDRTVNGSLPGADWFDVKTAQTARFQSTSITQVKPGQYLAKGTVSLRGVTVPVSLPFLLTIKGDTAFMSGQAELDRRSFKIGQESDASGSWVGFKVPVKVIIRANRVK